jgi:hypothetical protein
MTAPSLPGLVAFVLRDSVNHGYTLPLIALSSNSSQFFYPFLFFLPRQKNYRKLACFSVKTGYRHEESVSKKESALYVKHGIVNDTHPKVPS